MKWLLFVFISMSVQVAHCALKVTSPRQKEENLSPRFQALRDSGEKLTHRIIKRVQSLRQLNDPSGSAIYALKNEPILTELPLRRNSVSEISNLRNSQKQED